MKKKFKFEGLKCANCAAKIEEAIGKLDIEGIKAKAYTKTFGQINQTSTNDDFKAFAEGYLSLVNGNGHDINYKIYKANEEEISSGKIQ